MAAINFFQLQNLKCLKIKNKYTEHLSKLVVGHFYVVTMFSITKLYFSKDNMCQTKENISPVHYLDLK